MQKLILTLGLTFLLAAFGSASYTNEAHADVLPLKKKGQVATVDYDNGCMTVDLCSGGTIIISIIAGGGPGFYPDQGEYMEFTTKTLEAVCNNVFIDTWTEISGC